MPETVLPCFAASPACRAASLAARVAAASSRSFSLCAFCCFCFFEGMTRSPPAQRKAIGRAGGSQYSCDLSRAPCTMCVRVWCLVRATRNGPGAAHRRVIELLPHEPNQLSGGWKRRVRLPRSTSSRGWCPLVALNLLIGESTADPAADAVGHFWQMRLLVVLALKWNSFSPI